MKTFFFFIGYYTGAITAHIIHSYFKREQRKRQRALLNATNELFGVNAKREICVNDTISEIVSCAEILSSVLNHHIFEIMERYCVNEKKAAYMLRDCLRSQPDLKIYAGTYQHYNYYDNE